MHVNRKDGCGAYFDSSLDKIRLSALGRTTVRVGDLYCYFDDSILPSDDLPSKDTQTTLNTERFFFFQQPKNFQRYVLGFNSHLEFSIKKGLLDIDRLWLAEYLNGGPTENEEAQVTVFFRTIRQTEILDQGAVKFKMLQQFRLLSPSRVTHLVEEITYGSELICCMRRPVDWQWETNKENAEKRIYTAAKAYFDQNNFNPSSKNFISPPVELENLACTLFSSVKFKDTGSHTKNKVSFKKFCEYLTCVTSSSDKDDHPKWQPIDIVLRLIPQQMEILIHSEKTSDLKLETEQNHIMLSEISMELTAISNHPCLSRVLPLKKTLCHFSNLLKQLERFIFERPITMISELERASSAVCQPRPSVDMKLITELFADIKEWIIIREREILFINSLLENSQLTAVKDLEDIKDDDQNRARVFVVEVNYNNDTLAEKILRVIGMPNITDPAIKVPDFSILLSLETITELQKFNAINSSSRLSDVDCYICLVPVSSSSLRSGPVMELSSSLYQVDGVVNRKENDSALSNNHSDFSKNPSTKTSWPHPPSESFHYEIEQGNRAFQQIDIGFKDMQTTKPEKNDEVLSLSSSESESFEELHVNHQLPSPVDPLMITHDSKRSLDVAYQPIDRLCISGTDADEIGQSDQLSEQEWKIYPSNAYAKRSDCCSVESQQDEAATTHTNADGKTTLIDNKNGTKIGNSANVDQEKSKTENEDGESSVPQSNRRVAEIFAVDHSEVYQPIKLSQPRIYLLKMRECSINSSTDLRWFETGKREQATVELKHKVIILMGATGCGKSTLINGMVNYILGVQWKDPFRFKCVREDEPVARNQAHSQTSSVTAYTIHHHEGMAVPYSITIIDTPGYGDTRGIERDKEITQMIHRFLTQKETLINEIHAVCFVAASSGNRLTQTQRYIIDSVLSIFGRDFKENIRLLATFADNADPPIVSACLAANFPVTSQSAGIEYSKFNSSVLYASNHSQHVEDDFSFDELFWDMGKENFEIFFNMLERMNGRNLKSTREVIQHRHQLKQSLNEVEQELEVCLISIENMEMFQRKMSVYGHKMEMSKNFVVEKAVMRQVKVKCEKGFLNYYCNRCKKMCLKDVKETDRYGKIHKNNCPNQLCPCPNYSHVLESFEWRLMPEKEKTTLVDMKREYESNYAGKMTTAQLLAECSRELNRTKAKVFTLLEQVDASVRSLESTALCSNALSPADYLSLMSSRVAEEQKPGYMTRLETLVELQQMLAEKSITQPTLHVAQIGCNRDCLPSNRDRTETSFQSGCPSLGATKTGIPKLSEISSKID